MKSRKLVSLSILISLSIVSLIGCSNKNVVTPIPTQQVVIIASPTPTATPVPMVLDETIGVQTSTWRPLMIRTNEFGKPDYQTKEAQRKEDDLILEEINRALAEN